MLFFRDGSAGKDKFQLLSDYLTCEIMIFDYASACLPPPANKRFYVSSVCISWMCYIRGMQWNFILAQTRGAATQNKQFRHTPFSSRASALSWDHLTLPLRNNRKLLPQECFPLALFGCQNTKALKTKLQLLDPISLHGVLCQWHTKRRETIKHDLYSQQRFPISRKFICRRTNI